MATARSHHGNCEISSSTARSHHGNCEISSWQLRDLIMATARSMMNLRAGIKRGDPEVDSKSMTKLYKDDSY